MQPAENDSAARNEYCGMCINDDHTFDTQLVSYVIGDLKRGKAAGFDGLTAEHLLFCDIIFSDFCCFRCVTHCMSPLTSV